jgi:hypothetical protein
MFLMGHDPEAVLTEPILLQSISKYIYPFYLFLNDHNARSTSRHTEWKNTVQLPAEKVPPGLTEINSTKHHQLRTGDQIKFY